ncbi:hypothetical protein [Marinicellulosiphila megalodicopiae]|uniref:hypothetical protein n=1 Tax=Marinicellulosiphila megalodicopiae TaxID=2724896 RepID=UPI003BB1DEE2
MTLFKIFTLAILVFMTASCQVSMQKQYPKPQDNTFTSIPKQSLKKEGFWLSLETGQVIELLANGDLILNRFGSLEPESYTGDKFKAELDVQNQLVITLSDNASLKFQRPANIDSNQLSGQWFLYTNDGDYENSQLLSYQADGYQFESVELFHDDQSYSQYSEFLPYRFSNGFVFEDYFVDGQSYWYFLVESTSEFKTYIDEDGSIWTEEKYTDQPHVIVPPGYFNESF